MITGEIKNKVDAIWSTFWESAGITNPMDVLSQMTYLFFMKMLDDAQIKKEATAHAFGGGKISDPTFPDGEWTHPDSTDERPIRIAYRELRWSVFSKLSSENLFDRVRNFVFPFIKTLGHGSGSAYSRYMQDAVFIIQRPKALHRIVCSKSTTSTWRTATPWATCMSTSWARWRRADRTASSARRATSSP